MSDQEVEQAIVDNEKLVYFVVHRYFPNFHDDEDIIQVGRIGLWKACINYDSSKSKFSTFAASCIINEIKKELNNRAKMWKFGDIISLDKPLYSDKDGNDITLAHLVPDTRDDYYTIDYDLSFLESKLSKRDIEVFKLSICGFTAVEIGRAFGYTKSWVSRIIKNAQTIAKKAMANT